MDRYPVARARRARRVRRSPFILVAGVLAAAIALLAYSFEMLRAVELDTVDARFALRGAQAPDEVVVVAIDDRTFSDLEEQWPFPRSLHAKVIRRLRAAGAGRIAYDVQFTEPTTAREDLALFDAVAGAGGVVLAATEVDDRGRTNVLGDEANLREANARAAHANLPPDPGGVIRRLPLSIDGLATFAPAAARARPPPSEPPPPGPPSPAPPRWIDFHGPPGTIATVSFSRVLRGEVRPGLFRGRTVVVGASAPTLHDVHATSTSGEELMSGAEVQANAISTVERGFPLAEAPGGVGALAIALLALAAPLLSLRLPMLRTAALAGGLGLLLAIGAQLAFDRGLIVPFTYPLGALVLGTVGALAVHYAAERWDRQWTRALFARFVPAQVVDELLDRSGGEPRLGGVRLEATVMFCDLRGFTRFAERTGAEQVIEVLNRYLTEMSEAVLDQGGTLVSFMGDGIMAVFGSPIARDDHAEVALAAAREMLERRLPDFNAWLGERGGEPFEMGIGLSSGPVMSGNVGSERRLEYAAVGDTTNVAARLEAKTKDTPFQLLVADSTRELLGAAASGLTEVGPLEVPGRRAPIRAWTLADVSASGGAEPPGAHREPPAGELPAPAPASRPQALPRRTPQGEPLPAARRRSVSRSRRPGGSSR